nr:helix-turn-helix domain-containing protein [Neobacillus sp. Marseille-Q6967]
MVRKTMTVKELADYIGVSTDLVYKMVRLNEIPFIRVGRRFLFRKETIDNWMMVQETKGQIQR